MMPPRTCELVMSGRVGHAVDEVPVGDHARRRDVANHQIAVGVVVGGDVGVGPISVIDEKRPRRPSDVGDAAAGVAHALPGSGPLSHLVSDGSAVVVDGQRVAVLSLQPVGGDERDQPNDEEWRQRRRLRRRNTRADQEHRQMPPAIVAPLPCRRCSRPADGRSCGRGSRDLEVDTTPTGRCCRPRP